MRTWAVLTSRFLSVMGTKRIGCLIKVYQELKIPNFGHEQPLKFEFIINLKTAKQIGLTIPQSVLYLADKVIK